MAEPKLSGVILNPKTPGDGDGYTSPHRGSVMPGHDTNVKPAPPVGSPERRRIRIVPSSYQPHVAAPMTPPSHAPPMVRGMEDTEFNTRDVVVREGYLMKLKQTHRWAQHSRWNKRWFQLRGGFLLYFKRQGMDTPAGWLRVVQIREIKALENDTIIPGTNRASKNCVAITLHTRHLYLRARSKHEAYEWMSSIITCMRAAGVKLPVGAALTPVGVRVTESKRDGVAPGSLMHPETVRKLQLASEGEPESPKNARGAPPPVFTTAGDMPSPHAGAAQVDTSDAPMTPPVNRRVAALRELDISRTPPPKSPVHKWSGDHEVEWVEYFDDTYQRNYYVNTRTDESAWEIPKDAEGSAASEWVKCWDYSFDCAYYFNTRTEESRYDLPPVMHGVEPHWYGDAEGEGGEGDMGATSDGKAESGAGDDDGAGGDDSGAGGKEDDGDADSPSSPTPLPPVALESRGSFNARTPLGGRRSVQTGSGAGAGAGAGGGEEPGAARTPKSSGGGAAPATSPGGAAAADFDPLMAAFGANLYVPSKHLDDGDLAPGTPPSSDREPASAWAADDAAGDSKRAPSTPHRGAAPPEDHWVEYWDTKFDTPYYVHSVTGESTWELPEGAPVVHYDEGEYDYPQGYDPTTKTYYTHDAAPAGLDNEGKK